MKEKELISIIVPAFNIENYIERCLKSLLEQTYSKIEVIVINDGSTDGTKEKIENYALLDERIIVINTENRGVSHARNVGLNHARGTYIGFVDGDDEVEKDMYEILLDNAKTYKADISHCGYKMVFPTKEVEYYGTKIRKVQEKREAVSDLLSGYPIEPGMCNKLYKRELFGNIQLNERIKYNEDLLVNFYLFYKAEKTIYLDESKYHYILRKNSASTSKANMKKLDDPVKVWEEILCELKEEKDLYRIALNRYLYVLANNSLYFEVHLDKDLKQYRKECRLKLHRCLKEKETKEICKSIKMRVLVYGAGYVPWLMTGIKKGYSLLRKNSYNIEE